MILLLRTYSIGKIKNNIFNSDIVYHQTLCQPQNYKPMLDKQHTDDLKFFRQKSKSWTAGEKKKFARHSLRY